ncbi:MAG: ATP-binding protein [Gammaproteobacteria bacterium]|nr:ATP-binding protein [Gammaproteobacteria bacterium]
MFNSHNRRLLFRSYLWLVGGLLVVAVVLDFGFGHLQYRAQPDVNRWLGSTFRLITARLEEVPAAERAAVVNDIAGELGIGVHLLARDEVHMNDIADEGLFPLVDSQGNTSYLHDAQAIDAIIRLGPIAAPEDSLLLDLLPPIFYLSIFIVVGLWLRPLLIDIDVISKGAQRFAADYRDPPTTAIKTTELTPLARNIDEMAAKLSSVLRSQKELIAALSHEMRTPLARIRFALAVIDDKARQELKPKLVAMNEDVREIDELVSSMLNYARLDHPDIEMNWQAVPTRNWLDNVISKAPGDLIRIEANATGNTPGSVRMDPRLMELALSNLVVNATHYARREVRCSLAQDGDDYVLTVEDDGPGVPLDEREKIFKAFTRIDDSRNRETGGYGLGLAVVARVAELHGGLASVDASPALGGARFSVRWPVGQAI